MHSHGRVTQSFKLRTQTLCLTQLQICLLKFYFKFETRNPIKGNKVYGLDFLLREGKTEGRHVKNKNDKKSYSPIIVLVVVFLSRKPRTSLFPRKAAIANAVCSKTLLRFGSPPRSINI